MRDLEGVNFVDSQGSAKITEIHQLTDADGDALRLARVKPQVLAVLQADRVVDRIGADPIHGNVDRSGQSTADRGLDVITDDVRGNVARDNGRGAAGGSDWRALRSGAGGSALV